MLKRTQIYLSTGQWKKLNEKSFQTQESISHLIRKAIDQTYRKDKREPFDIVLKQVAGIWKDRQEIRSTQDYVRGLRKGSRLEALYGKKNG